MSDLISREAVIEVLKQTGIIQDNDLGHLVVDEINRIPTAYDLDKVVAELVEFGLNSMDKQIYDSDTYYDGVSVAIRKACNIVRKGGAE